MSIIHHCLFRALQRGRKAYLPGTKDYPAERARELELNKHSQAPRSVFIKDTCFGDVPGEFLSEKRNPEDRIIYYIHGGGFVTGSVKTRRAFTGSLVHSLGYNVAAVEYRLAPEYPFPAGAEDCLKGYEELLNTYASDKIVVLGESAGGNLVLSLLLQIKKKALPRPAAAVCIAPCVQFDQVLPSYTENPDTDAILVNLSEEVMDVYAPKTEDFDPRDPLFAPYYGDFSDTCPIYLWASESEILRDDSIFLYEKLRSSGNPCNLYLRKNMIHTWIVIPQLPEGKKDLKRIRLHLEDAFSGQFRQESSPIHIH